jgi:hypothetical protein
MKKFCDEVFSTMKNLGAEMAGKLVLMSALKVVPALPRAACLNITLCIFIYLIKI